MRNMDIAKGSHPWFTPILFVLTSDGRPLESTGTVQVDNETGGDYCYELSECQSHENELKMYCMNEI